MICARTKLLVIGLGFTSRTTPHRKHPNMSVFLFCIHTTLELLGEAEQYHDRWLKQGLSSRSDRSCSVLPAPRGELGASSPAAGSLQP